MLAAMLPILASCQTTTSGTNKVACTLFEPIRASSRDTDETKAQVVVHNAKFDRICI